MNRLLLAMLALLTGLVTQVAPAQARMGSGDTEIGSSEQIRVGKPSSGATQSAAQPTTRQERREREAQRPRTIPRSRVYIPSVLFGADRAYE